MGLDDRLQPLDESSGIGDRAKLQHEALELVVVVMMKVVMIIARCVSRLVLQLVVGLAVVNIALAAGAQTEQHDGRHVAVFSLRSWRACGVCDL